MPCVVETFNDEGGDRDKLGRAAIWVARLRNVLTRTMRSGFGYDCRTSWYRVGRYIHE